MSCLMFLFFRIFIYIFLGQHNWCYVVGWLLVLLYSIVYIYIYIYYFGVYSKNICGIFYFWKCYSDQKYLFFKYLMLVMIFSILSFAILNCQILSLTTLYEHNFKMKKNMFSIENANIKLNVFFILNYGGRDPSFKYQQKINVHIS